MQGGVGGNPGDQVGETGTAIVQPVKGRVLGVADGAKAGDAALNGKGPKCGGNGGSGDGEGGDASAPGLEECGGIGGGQDIDASEAGAGLDAGLGGNDDGGAGGRADFPDLIAPGVGAESEFLERGMGGRGRLESRGVGPERRGEGGGEDRGLGGISTKAGLGGEAAELLEGGDICGGKGGMVRGATAGRDPEEADFRAVGEESGTAGELSAEGGDGLIGPEGHHGIAVVHEGGIMGRKKGGIDIWGEAEDKVLEFGETGGREFKKKAGAEEPSEEERDFRRDGKIRGKNVVDGAWS